MIELHSWIFCRPGQEKYKRLCDVFEYSCKKQGVDIHVHGMKVPPIPIKGQPRWCPDNHYKLKEWLDFVKKEGKKRPGELILISDSDMLCLKAPPESYFDRVSVVGFTKRVSPARHFNAGMVMVRLGPKATKFFEEWYRRDTILFQDPIKHGPYKKKYYGMNQGSLGWILEDDEKLANQIEWYSCADMNLIQPWNNWEEAYFIHVKSQLAKYIHNGGKPKEERVRGGTLTARKARLRANAEKARAARSKVSVKTTPKKSKVPSDLLQYWKSMEREYLNSR